LWNAPRSIQSDAAAGNPFAAPLLVADLELVELRLQPSVLIDDGIEPADHCGGRLGLASSAGRIGRSLPQRMPGCR